MADSPEEIRKHVRTYWMVGIALFIFTGVTLMVAIVPFFDIGQYGTVDWPDIVLGLAIASTKSALVCLIFMHLNHEKGLIYKTLLFTIAFAIGLMGLTLFHHADPIDQQFPVTTGVGTAETYLE